MDFIKSERQRAARTLEGVEVGCFSGCEHSLLQNKLPVETVEVELVRLGTSRWRLKLAQAQSR